MSTTLRNLRFLRACFSHPGQHGIGQSQDALPVHPRKEEAVRRQDGSYVDDDGPIGASGDGDMVDTQFTFPVALSVPDAHSVAIWLVGTGAKMPNEEKAKLRHDWGTHWEKLTSPVVL